MTCIIAAARSVVMEGDEISHSNKGTDHYDRVTTSTAQLQR